MKRNIESEKIAKKYLEECGWCPERFVSNHTKHAKEFTGMPDFMCSQNRFVEIKKLSENHDPVYTNDKGSTGITGHQFDKIKELTQQNFSVFLMVFSHDTKTFDMFKIEHFTPKNNLNVPNGTL